MLKQFLLLGNNDALRDGKTLLYREVIRLQIFERLNHSFAGAHSNIHRAWCRHYKERVQAGESDFFMLAVSSFEFLSNEIHQLQVQSQAQANSSMTVVSNVE
jgi:hypothetical protein